VRGTGRLASRQPAHRAPTRRVVVMRVMVEAEVRHGGVSYPSPARSSTRWASGAARGTGSGVAGPRGWAASH